MDSIRIKKMLVFLILVCLSLIINLEVDALSVTSTRHIEDSEEFAIKIDASPYKISQVDQTTCVNSTNNYKYQVSNFNGNFQTSQTIYFDVKTWTKGEYTCTSRIWGTENSGYGNIDDIRGTVTYKVTKTTDYINDYRWSQDSSGNYTCEKYKISSCNATTCSYTEKYDKNGIKSTKSGTISRNSLVGTESNKDIEKQCIKTSDDSSTTSTKEIHDWRWEVNGSGYSCNQYYITRCEGSKCKYTKTRNSIDVVTKKSGTIDSSKLLETKYNEQAKKACGVVEINDWRWEIKGSGYSCYKYKIAKCNATECRYTEKQHATDSKSRTTESTIKRDLLLETKYNAQAEKTCKEQWGDKDTSGTSDKPSSSETSKYTVSFSANYGSGLACPSGYTGNGDASNLLCKNADVKANTQVSFPDSSSSMYKEGVGQLVGWTRIYENGKPNCGYDVIIQDLKTTFKASKNTYYACYERVFGGVQRFVQEGFLVSGNTTVKCGDAIYIEYCNKENNQHYCYFTDNNNLIKLDANKLEETYEAVSWTCTNSTNNADNVEQDKGARWITKGSDSYSCGDEFYITTCTDSKCNYTKITSVETGESREVSGTVNRGLLDDNKDNAKTLCAKQVKIDNEFETKAKCSNNYVDTKDNIRGTVTYRNFCYEESYSKEQIYTKIKQDYECADGFVYNTIVDADGVKNCNEKGLCLDDYTVVCLPEGKSVKPTLTVTSGIVQSNGIGTITVNAKALNGSISSYYVSEDYITPTNDNTWIPVTSDTFTIESTPGVKYIWVRDTEGFISNAVSGGVIDVVNTDTTAKSLQITDEKGEVQSASNNTAYYMNSIKSSKYVMMSNDLSKDSKVLADGFNPFDMEYKLEVESPTVSVYATLTSTDSSYVPGYEPRTVNLKYGVNTVLIKIRNKEGKIRTYTILVTRTDDRTSDNTLSDMTVSEGKLTFNANVTEYKVEIPKNTNIVEVKSTIGSDKASYVPGYEPGNVDIIGDTTVKLIKVQSETGSTRTYVLSFVKEGTDKITKESLQLADLTIPGVNVAFEKDIANYNLSVGYETDVIDLLTTVNDENSIVSTSIKRKNDSEYTVTGKEGIKLDVGENFIELKVTDLDGEVSYYRLTIIRKEFGLDISNDTTLKDLKVMGANDYEIKFEPNKKEYTVKIKREKTLVITAVPTSNRAEVFIRGNEELTGFSTVRVKVIAENGEYETYSIDIKKDAFNKPIEILAIIIGAIVILGGSIIIISRKKSKSNKEYFEE